MRKWITFLMTFLIGSASYVNAVGQVEFEAGYRHDNISWRHRIPASDPVFKTNTRFKDLDIFQIGLSGRTTIGCNLYLRARGYWGWILDGEFRQGASIYASESNYYDYNDIREGVTFSEGNRSIIDDQWVYGVSGAVGYPFYFCDCSLVLAPVVGYAFDEQNIHVHNEGIDFSRHSGNLFPRRGERCCRHTFITRWYGPFVGVDFTYRPCNECWSLYAEGEYHWGNFRGKRSEDSFDVLDGRNHSSHEATGWVFAAGVDYDVSDCWTIGLSARFQDWTATRHHRERDSDVFSEEQRSRDNHKWNSYAINVTVGRHF